MYERYPWKIVSPMLGTSVDSQHQPIEDTNKRTELCNSHFYDCILHGIAYHISSNWPWKPCGY